MGEIGKFRVTEMLVHDMVFKEVLEINAHACTYSRHQQGLKYLFFNTAHGDLGCI